MQMVCLARFLRSLADNAGEAESICNGMWKALEKDYRQHYDKRGGTTPRNKGC